MNYICDFCNTVVDEGINVCPNCGLGFSKTRCPICNFVGHTKLFRKGCPKCIETIIETEKNEKKKDSKSSFITLLFRKFNMLAPVLKITLLIVGLNIILIWYITYAELFK